MPKDVVGTVEVVSYAHIVLIPPLIGLPVQDIFGLDEEGSRYEVQRRSVGE